jgi:hypothetical protein
MAIRGSHAGIALRDHDRFELVRVLGEGGMGVVYEVFDRTRGETVALKTLRNPSGEAIYRMKREFRALANLEHPNLVRLFDLFVEQDTCFFTMELVSGTDLHSYLGLHGEEARPEEALLRRVFAGLCQGLEALHRAGLLHRDLKPSNALITPQGRVVLLDFGLVLDTHAPVQQTAVGAVAGTAAYMAPEQARGESELTTACDVYALGVMLFEFLTGQLPFRGPPLQVMLAKDTQEPARASLLAGGVPADLDDLALRMMARDPLARPRLSEVRTHFGPLHASSSATQSFRSADSAQRLLGRDAELEALEALHASALADGLALGLVRGRSGLGKSALIQAFARKLEASGTVVLSGRCYESESVPFKGLDGTIDALSRVLTMMQPAQLARLLPPDLADLGTLFPVLRRLKPVATAYARRRALDETPVHRIRSQGLAALREILRRLSQTAPLLLVLDDVQWADEDSAAALIELVQGEDPPRMTVLVGTRPDDAAPVVSALFGAARPEPVQGLRCQTVDLEPLSFAALRELAERELGTSGKLGDLVARDAQGNPFAACELVRFLREGELDPAGLDGSLSIDAIVCRRADKLDASVRHVLELLVVAGEPTSADLLLRALGLPEDDRSPLDALRVRSFVRTVRASGGNALDVAHDRIREAVAAALPEARHAELHRLLAVAMEGLETPPHDRLARHYAAANEPRLGCLHAVAAAEQARSALAFRRAADFYALAVRLGPGDVRIHTAHGEVLATAGRYEESALAFSEGARRADGIARAQLEQRAAETLLYAGRIDDGLRLLEAGARGFGLRLARTTRGKIWEAVKARLRLALRGYGYQLRNLSEVSSVELDRVRGLGAIASTLGGIDPVAGIGAVTRWLLAALRLGIREELQTAFAYQAAMLAYTRELRASRRMLARLHALGASDTTVLWRVSALISESMVDAFSGESAAAARSAKQAVELCGAPGIPAWLQSNAHQANGVAGVLRLDLTPFELAHRFIQEREQAAGPFAELRNKAFYLTHYWLRIGEPEQVLAMSDSELWARATSRPLVARALAQVNGAWAALYRGDIADAWERALAAREAVRRTSGFRNLQVRGATLRVLAAAALAGGRLYEVSRAARAMGRPTHGAGAAYAMQLGCLVAVVSGGAPSKLFEAAEFGRKHQLGLVEGMATWGLGSLLPGPEGAEHRRRCEALVAPTRIADPSRLFWSMLPVGEPPPRTRTRTVVWGQMVGGTGIEPATSAL